MAKLIARKTSASKAAKQSPHNDSSKVLTQVQNLRNGSDPDLDFDPEDGATTEDDDEEDSEEQDSDQYDDTAPTDVSKKGLRRLMAALEKQGVDEVDAAVLSSLSAQDNEEDDDDDEDEEAVEKLGSQEVDDEEEDETGVDEDDKEQEDEDEDEDEGAEQGEKPVQRDSLAASLLRSGLVAQEQEDDDEEEEDEEDEDEDEEGNAPIPIDELGDVSALPSSVLATRQNRVRINNQEALRRALDEFRLDGPDKGKMPWVETMDITWDQDVVEQVGGNVEDDLKRELVFYKQSLYAAMEAHKRATAQGLPFARPSDFFAEMVKTDEHMERVRQKLLDERAGIKASEEAKRQRELKKFGKKVQVEKLLERQKRKKEMVEKVKGLKRKHSSLDGDVGEDDDRFDIQLEDALQEKQKPSARRKMGKGKDGRAKMPRSKRDEKYGFGGKKRHLKENTKESTNDFSMGSSKKRRISGTAGFRKPTGAKKSRPGKSKRAAQR